MTQIPIEQLKLHTPLEEPLYHRTGTVLFPAGASLVPQHIESMAASNILSLFTVRDPADLARLKKKNGLHPVRLESLQLHKPLPHDICNEQATVLLSRNVLFERQHREALAGRNLTTVYVPSAESLQELDAYAFHAARQQADMIDRDLPEFPERLSRSREEAPFLDNFARIVHRSTEQRAATRSVRAQGGTTAATLLSSLREARAVKTDVPQLIEQVIEGFSHDANYLLKLSSLVQQEGIEDPRADHLINVCLNALAIGTHLGYSEPQLKHLGACAFLHDIGMVRVPSEILVKRGPLLPLERLEVERHTIHALDLLDRIPSVDAGLFLPIYQSHERIDGTGYPKGRKPPFIHEFARIIGVADTYAALCAPRAHRQAKSPHEAMAATIQLAAKNALDKTVLRAFLFAVGLFPIGSWVLLSTGETARVISTGDDTSRYDRPTVSVLFSADGSAISPPATVKLAERAEISVAQVLPPDAFGQAGDEGF